MLKNLYLLVALISFTLTTRANVGDTTWVQATHVNLNYYNNFDTAVAFPTGSNTYRKIYMICTLGQYNCPAGSQYCHQWDYDIENIVMTPTGDTLEISRFVTPFATSGTPGFGPSWQQHYIFDVTDFYPVLKNNATLRAHYSGYSGGFTLDTKFAFIEGTPERNVLGISPLWNRTYTFGDQMNVIDSNLKSITKTPVAGTVAAEMKVTITGHGADSASGCCEFDYTGAGHSYTVVANNAPIAQTSMNVNCGSSELYPQGGTWASARAGAWCPGGLVTTARYRLPGATAGSAYPVDLDFDNSYDGLGHYGVYIVASSMFYYGAYNKSVDASVEDIIAPTNFEGYRRENPRASVPVVKIRNTGSTAITTMLIEYGVQDSIPQLYIFNGSLSAGADTIISLPAVTSITSLSLGGAAGLYNFNTKIISVNGSADNDPSNDKLSSRFVVAPTWPSTFAINMLTSSLDANGGLGGSPSDASWQITDEHNVVVASRTNANVKTAYKDTVTLNSSGWYTLAVATTQCAGLHWWPYDRTTGYAGGTLAVRDYINNKNLNLSGNNAGYYHDDFGCGLVQYFTTGDNCPYTSLAITRSGSSLIAPGGSGYQWYLNGVAIRGATSSSYLANKNNGNYTVKVTDVNGCATTTSSYALINLGLSDVTDRAAVIIAPNPSSGSYHIQVAGELIGSGYTVFDLMGREVLVGTLSSENTSIAMQDCERCIYLLAIAGQTYKLGKQ